MIVLQNLLETFGGIGSVILAILAIILVFKVLKGFFKIIGVIFCLGLIALAVCLFMGII